MSLYDRDYMRDEAPSFGDHLRQVSAFHWFFWANIIVYVFQWVLFSDFCLTHEISTNQYLPAGGVSIDSLTQGHVWTPFTYMFVHGSIGHIILNSMMLWFAGKRVQDLYGPRHFVIIYVASGIIGAALQIVLSAYVLNEPSISLIGASASIMGLLLAYAIAMPDEEVTLLLAFIIPVRFRLWGLAKFLLITNIVFAALAAFDKLPNWLSGGGHVAYLAHIGGALAGWYYARILGYGGLQPVFGAFPSPPKARRRPAMARVSRPVVEIDMDAVRRKNPRNDPVVDLIRDEVDPILDKISTHGLNSLTDDERRTLDRASRQIARTKGK
jgi:membrane associated rhomboid family serine protease